ncbi:MAG: hypothetical protein K2Q33_08280, partial [Gammaproteobacteria bacterium]|nr:hypothetical protein [Gammaproteobacteria bacterium]
IPHIEWLIEQLKPGALPSNPKAYQELATLQFIYICLTQLHFHKTCPCPATFRGQPDKVHNYYDHLYQLGLIATLSTDTSHIQSIITPNERLLPSSSHEPIKISGETVRLHSIAGGLTDYPIKASIGLTLFPLFAQVTGSTFCQEFTFIPIMRWHTLQRERNLADRLYVRYSCDLASSSPPSFLLFLSDNKNQTLDDFDFRGSHFRKIDFHYINSMLNADCRSTVWESCIAPWFKQGNAKTCKGSVFTDSYYRPYIDPEWGRNIVPRFDLAQDWSWYSRPKFPAYINNSCFFTMQNSKFNELCSIQ